MDTTTIIKRAIGKLNSFMIDIHELLDDEDSNQLTPDQTHDLMMIKELGNTMMVKLMNDVKGELDDEADFLNDLEAYDDEFEDYSDDGDIDDDDNLLNTAIQEG